MRKKFTGKVVVLFSTLLLLFSAIATFSYQYFYYKNFIEHTRKSLMTDAYNISKSISEEMFISEYNSSVVDAVHNNKTTGTDLTLYERLIVADFYLVDPDGTMYANQDHTVVSQKVDPSFMHAVDEAFLGNYYSVTEKAEKGQTELICAVPVTNRYNDRVGVIVVRSLIPAWYHSSYNGINFLLLSLMVSFLIVVLIAVLSSKVLTRPILELNESTQELVKEKYDERNHICREDEIGQLASSLNTLAAKMAHDQEILKNEEAYKRRFLSQISHELKTPVTIMKGSLELLSDGFVQEEDKKQEYYAQMLEQSDHLQHRINEILDLTKLQTPEFEIKRKECSFSEILSEAVMDVRALVERKHMEIVCDPFDGEDTLYCDENRIRQMLVILLDNAVKYSKENGTVEIRYDNTYVSIQDHGIGISKDALSHIGDPYFRAALEYEGNGLGLCIVKEICKRHNFVFDVQSESGKGTTVTVRFRKAETN